MLEPWFSWVESGASTLLVTWVLSSSSWVAPSLNFWKNSNFQCKLSTPGPRSLKNWRRYPLGKEVCTGVFLWCVIGWFYFPWKVNLGIILCDPLPEGFEWPLKNLNYSLISVISQLNSMWFCEVVQMVRAIYWEWLRDALCDIESLQPFTICLSSNTNNMLFITNEYLTCLFLWLGKMKFLYPWSICDPQFLHFVNHVIDPPL